MYSRTLNDVLLDIAKQDQGDVTAKQARNFAPAALLADETLAQLVCAWPNVPVQPLTGEHKSRPIPHETPAHREMRWAFAQIDPDPIPIWLEMAGLPDAPHTRRAVYVAIDQKLVRPDGTLSTWASRFAEEALKNAVANAGKRRGTS
jgi:hypothetical protein